MENGQFNAGLQIISDAEPIDGDGITTGDRYLLASRADLLQRTLTITKTDNSNFDANSLVLQALTGDGAATFTVTGYAGVTEIAQETVNLADGVTDTAMLTGFTNIDRLVITSDSDILLDDLSITAADVTAPTVTSIERQTPMGEDTNADSLTFRVTFSEDVANVDADDFIAQGGATAAVTNVTPVAGNVYDVTLTNGSLAGYEGAAQLGLDVLQNIEDAAGNALTDTTPSGANEGYTLDNTPPAVAITSPALAKDETPVISGTAEVGTTVTLTVAGATFETVATDGNWSVDLESATPASGILGLNTDGSDNPLSVTATDAAGNVSIPALQTLVIDAIAPAVSSIVVDGTPAASDTEMSFTVTFAEAVTGVDALDFQLTGTDTAAGAIASVSGGGSTYTVAVENITGEGSLRLDLRPSGTGIVDAAGNAIADGGYTGGSTHGVTAPPAPTISSIQVPAGTYAAGQTIFLHVFFDQEVVLSGGIPSLTVEIGGQTVDAPNWAQQTSDSLAFSYQVQPGNIDANGIVIQSFELNGATIENVGGEPADLTLPLGLNTSNVLVDTVGPTIQSVSVPTADTYAIGETLTFTVNFDENVSAIGPVTLAIDVGGQVREATLVPQGVSNALLFEYEVQAGDEDGDGIVVLGLTGVPGYVTDSAGNPASFVLANVGVATGVLVDGVAPTVAITSAALTNNTTPVISGTAEDGAVIDVTVGGQIFQTTATGGVWSIDPTQDAPIAGLPSSNLAEGDNLVVVGARDAAGNVTGPIIQTLVIDLTPPTVQSITMAADGTYGIGDVFSLAVVLSEPIQGGAAPVLQLRIGEAVVTAEYDPASTGTTLHYTYEVQPGDVDANGIEATSLTGYVTDPAGNVAPAILPILSPSEVLVDGIAPEVVSIDLVGAPSAAATKLSWNITFSEAVDNISTVDFALAKDGADGDIVSVVGEDETWTVMVGNVSGEGKLGLNLKADSVGIVDLADNPLDHDGFEGAVHTVDRVGPVITAFAGPDQGDYKAGDILHFRATFSEALAPLGPTDIVALGVTIGENVFTAFINHAASTGNDLAFMLPITAGAGGAVTVGAIVNPVGLIKDGAGNTASLDIPSGVLPASTLPGVVVDGVAPIVNPNIKVTLTEGVADRALLELQGSARDPGEANADIVFTLTEFPTLGTLTILGAEMSTGLSFTRADVLAGNVRYTHNGTGAGTDTFSFLVSDGINEVTGGLFTIDVKAAPSPGQTVAPVVVQGGIGNDLLVAGGSGNRIVGGLGDDEIIGGSGLDTAVYSLNRKVFSFSQGAVSGPEGNDTLQDVESLEFVDATIDFVADSRGHLIERMYEGVFGRATDAMGIAYWADRMDDGWSALQVVEAMMGSAEYQAMPAVDDATFVAHAYQTVLNRAAEDGGVEHHVALLEAGSLSRAELLLGFVNAAEALGVDPGFAAIVGDWDVLQTARAYQVFLGRAGDLEGIVHNAGLLGEGLSMAELQQGLVGSGEFQAFTSGFDNDADFVEALYQRAFGRSGDADGIAYWEEALQNGASRADLAIAFHNAAEGLSHFQALAGTGIDLMMPA